jgi:hypothetical protein
MILSEQLRTNWRAALSRRLHGSSYIRKSDKLLTDLAGVIKESFE